jgi:type I restriction enzyme R subunit
MRSWSVADLLRGNYKQSDNDKVIDVRSVIRGKLLESTTLQQQAAANSKEQFGASPDLGTALMDAIISALDAHQAMSSQALGSASIRDGMKAVLINQTGLYEELRERAAAA